MDEDEQLLWGLVYIAATFTRDPEPRSKADNAVIAFRTADKYLDDDDGPDPFPPEHWPNND